jgi:probable rRNA maturation factor
MSSPEGSTVTFWRSQTEVRPAAVHRFARELQAQVAGGRPFDCLITGDAHMRRLNREFRRKDYPTDVLSFPADGGQTPAPGRAYPAPAGKAHLGGTGTGSHRAGDIAISLPRARVQARRLGHSTEQEIRVLMLHGLLHLLGQDHERDSGRMARVEKRWRARLGLPAGLIERVRP